MTIYRTSLSFLAALALSLSMQASSEELDRELSEVAPQLQSFEASPENQYQWAAELKVKGEVLTVLLNDSDVISGVKVVHSSGQARVNSLYVYSGVVVGETDSWVRLTLSNGQVRGVVAVGGEKHELLPQITSITLSSRHAELLDNPEDIRSESLTKAVTLPLSKDKLNDYLRRIKAEGEINLEPGVTGYVALIGVVIDTQFNDYYNGRGLDEVLSILNSLDGIFREQLGVALKVDTVLVIDDPDNDPMNLGYVSMHTMLHNFIAYRNASADLGSDISFATLFTGNKHRDNSLSSGYTGSACRTDGYDVTLVTPYRNLTLLSAFAIGQAMGAPLDTNTECRDQTNHIMWPFIRSEPIQTFSSCSVEAIAQAMENNSCYIEAIDIGVTLTDVSNEGIEITVSNQDLLRAAPGAKINITGPGVGRLAAHADCSRSSELEYTCNVGSTLPKQSVRYHFDFNDSSTEGGQVIVNLHADGFLDVETYNNVIQVEIPFIIEVVSESLDNSPTNLNSGSDENNNLDNTQPDGGNDSINVEGERDTNMGSQNIQAVDETVTEADSVDPGNSSAQSDTNMVSTNTVQSGIGSPGMPTLCVLLTLLWSRKDRAASA